SFVPRILWPEWPVSLRKSVHRHEARHILRALREARGVVTKAAKDLGLTHQGLQQMLKTRHKELLKPLAEIKAGKEKIIPNDSWDRAKDSEPRAVRILHVEDDETIAAMAKEMLEEQGWQVETCANGNVALQRISGSTNYDLLLVDYKLPDMNGLALVRRARQ